MKLKDWADKTGITYSTAWKWFKAGTLPVNSYQTTSGTIIVDDETTNINDTGENSNDIMALIFNKVVDCSKDGSTIADFAAYVLSNFKLKRITKVLPLPLEDARLTVEEEAKKHLNSFKTDHAETVRLKEITELLRAGKVAGDIFPAKITNGINDINETETKADALIESFFNDIIDEESEFEKQQEGENEISINDIKKLAESKSRSGVLKKCYFAPINNEEKE